MDKQVNVLITSYLEEHFVDQIRSVDPRLQVVYEPSLIAPPRYVADHNGDPSFRRTQQQEVHWRRLLQEADILFDFDHTHREDLPELAPHVRLIQFTSSGIGMFVEQTGYARRMPDTVFATASGVHAQPLAEFCIMVMLMFTRRLARMLDYQEKKVWERFTGSDLLGSTLTVVGAGRVGSKVAAFAKAMGMHVLGVVRDAQGRDPASLNVDELFSFQDLMQVLPRSEYLVLITPHTPETDRMMGREQLEAMPQGAVFINIGRGALVVEDELIRALQSGHLAGAGLDVFATEPLPQESPLWTMPNVLVSPHSASTSDKENALITDLFCDNLRRFLAGLPLRNVLDVKRLY